MPVHRLLKWAPFLLETYLLITVFGELFDPFRELPVISGLYEFTVKWIVLFLFVALILHLAAWLVLHAQKLPVTGNIFGFFATLLGIVPILGGILRCTTVFLLLIELVVMHTSEEFFTPVGEEAAG